jgi:hypothetical protein
MASSAFISSRESEEKMPASSTTGCVA